MHQGKYVFAQIIEFIPRHEFDKFVKRHADCPKTKLFFNKNIKII